MKVLILGSKGLLGSYLSKYLKNKNVDVTEADLPEYNACSYHSLIKLFQIAPDQPYIKYDYLINCVAYTDVAKAEEDQKKAYYLNVVVVGVLATLCLNFKSHLIHFSTDFVFDGLGKKPYKEFYPTHPVNYYGVTKLEGENLLIKRFGQKKNFTIFRLQWLFGLNDKTFFMKLWNKSLSNDSTEVAIVSDEIGYPCSVAYVSEIIYGCLTRKDFRSFRGRIFHLSHGGLPCSRYECAKYFLEKMESPLKVVPILTNNIDSVKRPKYSALCTKRLCRSLHKWKLPSWKEDLDYFIEELKKLC